MGNKRKLISILTAFGIVVTSIWQPKSIANAKSNEELKEVFYKMRMELIQ